MPEEAVQKADFSLQSSRYAYTLLSKKEQALYQRLYTAAKIFSTEQTPLPFLVESTQLERVWQAVQLDHPEFYWVERPIQSKASNTFFLQPLARLDAQQAQVRQQKIEEVAGQILEGICGQGADAAAKIHDALLSRISYVEGGADADNLYGGLVEGKGVCGAYSAAYQYLLQRQGIDCAQIRGKSVRNIPHSWNVVRLEDGWYYADPTWNDRPVKDGYLFHDYLFLTLEEFALDHFPQEGLYSTLPPAESDQFCYYRLYGFCADADAEDPIAQLAKGFVNQLIEKKEMLKNHPAPIFLEIKVFGNYPAYQQVRDQFSSNLFLLLQKIEQELKVQNIPIAVETTGYIKYDYNDTTQVLNLFANAYMCFE